MTGPIVALTHYLPIFTTVISAVFAWLILSRYRTKRHSKQLLWWGIGVAVYGAGTLVEAMTTLFGWHVVVFKIWYITGALLGGAPLALGTVYLFFSKKVGDISAILLFTVVTITSAFVILSPVNYSLVDSGILSSRVLAWQSIRLVSPFINSAAALVLIGGALYSAGVYVRRRETRNRFIGNVLIAIGALLPGIGGLFSRLGHTEVLYVGELLGIIAIWSGYRFCQRPAAPTVISEAELAVSEKAGSN
jgi:hypothetical protein